MLKNALLDKHPVQVDYHEHQRILCPHLLGWKNGRARALCYQTSGATSEGPLSPDRLRRWRLIDVDEIRNATITDDQWQTATNYRPSSNGIDIIELAIRT